MWVAKLWMVCATLLAVLLGEVAAEISEPTFEAVQETNITLQSSQCLPFGYMVNASRTKLDVDFSYFPSECNITETLSITTNTYMQGQCISLDTSDHASRCASRIASAADICGNWNTIGSMVNESTIEGNITSFHSDWSCPPRWQFIGFKSSCSLNATIGLKVLAANLTGEEYDICTSADTALKKYRQLMIKTGAIAAGILFLALILLIILAIYCCCGGCCSCGQHEKDDNSARGDESVVEVLISSPRARN